MTASVYVSFPPNGAASWREPVSTATALPATGVLGEARAAQDTGTVYIWTGSAWVAVSGGGGGITALTGDVTASGSGSVAASVAKIQGTAVAGTTGTTNVVLSSSPTISAPTLSGTTTAGVISASGTVAANGASNTGSLNTKSLGTGVSDGFVFTSSGGSNTWGMNGRDSGLWFLYDGSNTMLTFQGSLGGTGPASPSFHWDVNCNFDNHAVPTAPSTWALSITNGDGTNNSYSPLVFVNSSTKITGMISGVHETQTSSPTGHLSFFTSLSGTLTEQIRITSAGLLQFMNTQYTTGSGTPQLGSNCPASTLIAPNTWIEVKDGSGNTLYIPAWK